VVSKGVDDGVMTPAVPVGRSGGGTAAPLDSTTGDSSGVATKAALGGILGVGDGTRGILVRATRVVVGRTISVGGAGGETVSTGAIEEGTEVTTREQLSTAINVRMIASSRQRVGTIPLTWHPKPDTFVVLY
jgi:hypothetical protein